MALKYYEETQSYAAPNQKIVFESPIYTGTGTKKKRVGTKKQTVYTGASGERLDEPPVKVVEAEGVTFISPNKPARETTATKSAITQITETATGKVYTGKEDIIGGRNVFVGFRNVPKSEQEQRARIIEAKKQPFFSISAEGEKEASTSRAKTIAKNIAIKQALPISTYKYPEAAEYSFKVTETTTPVELTPIQKGLKFLSTPIGESFKNPVTDFINKRAELEYNIEQQSINELKSARLYQKSGFLQGYAKFSQYVIDTKKQFITTELQKPIYYVAGFAGNVAFKAGGKLAGFAFSKLPQSAKAAGSFIAPGLTKGISYGLLGGYATYQTLEVTLGGKKASTATAETLASLVGFKVTQKPAEFLVTKTSATANTAITSIKNAYSQYKADIKFKKMRGDVGDFLISAEGRKTPVNNYFGTKSQINAGQLNLYNKPANLRLNQPSTYINPLQTREGYILYGGKYALQSDINPDLFGTVAGSQRAVINLNTASTVIKDVGQRNLIKDTIIKDLGVTSTRLEGGKTLASIEYVPKITSSAKYTQLNPISVKDITVLRPELTQKSLIDYGITKISFKPKTSAGNAGFTNINTFVRNLDISAKISAVNVFNNPPKYTPPKLKARSTVGSNKAGAAAVVSTSTTVVNPTFKAYSGYTPKTPFIEQAADIVTTPRPPISSNTGVFKLEGGITPPQIKTGLIAKKSLSSGYLPSFKIGELELNKKATAEFSGEIIGGKEATAVDVIKAVDVRRLSAQRQTPIQTPGQIGDITLEKPGQEFKPGITPPSIDLGFKSLKITYKTPTNINLAFPKFNFNFFKQNKGGSLFSFGNQPKAYKPSVRAAFFNLRGKTSRGATLTGISERYIPINFKGLSF